MRKLLGPQAIATIPGRGYRFKAEIAGPTDAKPAPQAEPSDARAQPETTSPAAPPVRPGNLAGALPPLVGRDDAVDALARLAATKRLVSIAGAPGIGKTAVAQALARRLADNFADGAWWIELAPVTDAELVTAIVAGIVGIRLGADASAATLAGRLRGARMLLVLDNCEHLLGAVADLAHALLDHAPDVHLVVTTQEPLRLAGEQVFRLEPLALPEPGADVDAARRAGTVALFEARAQAADPRFAVDAGNLEAVVDVCRHLDGLPLAIELAAARVPLLGVAGLRARLGERLRVLTAGHRLALRRHQTLREAFEWSHGLLGADEQAVFRRLGVFVGSFDLESAQQGAAGGAIDEWATLDILGALVDKSLVTALPGDPPRYALLETGRAFALEKLQQAGETEAAADAHLRAMVAKFEPMGDVQWAASYAHFDKRHAADLDNLRAALDWAARDGGDREALIALTASTAPMWRDAPSTEALRRYRLAMSLVTEETPERDAARVLLNYALRAHPKSTPVELDAIERGIALCRKRDDRLGLYFGLSMSVLRFSLIGRLDEAQRAADEAESLRASVPLAAQARLPMSRAHLHELHGDHEAALGDKLEALRASERAGDLRGALIAKVNVVDIQLARGNIEEAVRLGREVVAQFRLESGPVGMAFLNLCAALTRAGELDEALQIAQEAVPLLRRDGHLELFLDHCALLALKRGRHGAAARALGRSRALFAASGDAREINEQRACDDAHAALQQTFPADELERLMAEGEALDAEGAVRDALAA